MKQVMGWIGQARSTVKTIFGMPDYDKYLERHNVIHPDKPLMSEKEYYLEALKNRFDNGTVTRCC